VILHGWNKNNSEWGFSVFFEKRTKSCFFSKTQVGCFFFEKTQVFFNADPNSVQQVTSLSCYISGLPFSNILFIHLQTVSDDRPRPKEVIRNAKANKNRDAGTHTYKTL